jgi:ABC-2 type transport system permease protein
MVGSERPGSVRRLLQLWRVYAYLDFMFLTRDPRSFLWYALSDLALSLAAVTATLLLAARFDGIGDWSRDQVLFMLGFAVVVGGIHDLFFGYNIKFISRRIGRGQLDHLLVQPQPLWQGLVTEGFLPFSASGTLLVGVGLLAWATANVTTLVSANWVALLLANLAGAAAIGLAFSFLWSSLAFWAPSAAEEISSSANRLIHQLQPFPLDGLAAPLQILLLTALPAGFIAWYPSRALLGLDPRPLAAIVTPLAGLLAVGLAVVLFRRGLRHYGTTGSQRYSAFGHRR